MLNEEHSRGLVSILVGCAWGAMYVSAMNFPLECIVREILTNPDHVYRTLPSDM